MKLRILTLFFVLMTCFTNAFAETQGTLSDALSNISKMGYNVYRIVWHPEKGGFYNAVAYGSASDSWAFIQTKLNGEVKDEYLISKPASFKGDPTTLNLMPAVKAANEAGYTPLAATWTPSFVEIDAVTKDDMPVKLKVDSKTNRIK